MAAHTHAPRKIHASTSRSYDAVAAWNPQLNPGIRLIGHSLRGEAVSKGIYHLVAQIWIRNAGGEVLVQKRALNLKRLPGIWAVPAGSVVKGETALEGAVRELREEMGIDLGATEFRLLRTEKRWPSIFCSWSAMWEGNPEQLDLQEEEVADARWVSKEWIRSEVNAGRFFDYGEELFSIVFGA